MACACVCHDRFDHHCITVVTTSLLVEGKIFMLRLTTLYSALAPLVCLAGSGVSEAGGPGCGCGNQQAHVAPVYASPMMQVGPAVQAGCACAAVPSYSGGAGVGMGQLGSLYGSSELYGGGMVGRFSGSADPNSFQSGFENLPNMDGGGTHRRLPYHSYRRPWAHPGIADNNINIVW